MRRNELTPAIDFSYRQEELYSLLERQVKLYTMGDSTSLPAETAQGLLRSICFCIETHLTLSSEPAGNHPLVQLFEEGQRDVWRLTEEVKLLYHEAKSTDPGFGSIAYRDTLDAIGDFFRFYDLRFFAHDIPCSIDYPLCHPVPEALEGVRYIGEYLRRLIIENRFCGLFERQDAIRLLGIHQPEYRELILNLFEPAFACALGIALLNRNAAALQLNAEGCGRIYEFFRLWDENQSKGRLHEAVNRLCIRFRLWDAEMRAYLMNAAENLPPRLRSTTREGYCNLFCASQQMKSYRLWKENLPTADVQALAELNSFDYFLSQRVHPPPCFPVKRIVFRI